MSWACRFLKRPFTECITLAVTVFCIISLLHASHTVMYPVYIRTTTNQSLEMSYGRDSSYRRGRGRSYGSGSASRSFNRDSPAPKPVEVGRNTKQTLPKLADKEMGWRGCRDSSYLLKMEKLDRRLKLGSSKQEIGLLQQQQYLNLGKQLCHNK